MLRQLCLSLLYAALFAASFAGVSSAFRSIVPWPNALGLATKVEYFEAHKDEYDLVVIGSSRSARGVDSVLVEEELARHGIEARTFNLAVGGMRTFEQDFVLHEILDMRPARLKWVLFEGGPVGMGLREDHVFRNPNNLWTTRGVFWHTPESTAKVLRAIRRLPLPWTKKLVQAATHVQIMMARWVSYGMGGAVVARARGREDRVTGRARDEVLEAQGGHQGLEQVTGRDASLEMEELLRDPEPYLARVRAIPDENAMDVPFEEIELGIYREQLDAARELGVELVYFTPPGYEGTPERLRVHEAGILPALLHFSDPELYPELFQLEYRFDKGHLNRRGVERFSRLLAAALAEHLSAGGRGAE